MKIPFRQYHLLSILSLYENSNFPLDLILRNYFRKHHSVGSKDRKEIAETTYGIVRWQGLLDHLGPPPHSWEQRHKIYSQIDPFKYFRKQNIPPHTRLSFPKPIYKLINQFYGCAKTEELCLASNTPAPTTIRANTLKTTRSDLFKAWQNTYDISLCKHSTTGITFHKKINFFSLPEFKQGLFEIQDEGSQLVAMTVKAQPKQQILDYCAGSGGKSLAFAPLMKHSGQIFLHDIRPHILLEAKKRLFRAGIQNAQTLNPDSPQLKRLKKRMDWVLVDAPCSGSGTIRRNPDMKWNFSMKKLRELTGMQRSIFEKALSYMHPNGHIVYATCSLFEDENEAQVEHFLKTYNLKLQGYPFKSLPSKGEMDGFFAATFTF